MKETYKFLTKNLPIILVGAVLTTILGVIALVLGYNSTTSWLQLRASCTIIFAVVGFATMCYGAYIAYKTPNVHIKRIKKSDSFLRTASSLAFAVSFFIFGFELIKILLASYESSFSQYFSIWRILRFVFSLPCAMHFFFMAMPTKIGRKKIVIPKKLLYVTSVSTVIWAIMGLLATYFANEPGKNLTTMNILKIWQILVYLCFVVFFLFEAKFEHINQAPRGYIFSGCLAFISAMAFMLTTLIGLALRTIPARNCFSAPELICLLIIGVYAYARIHAIVHTMKHVMNNGDRNSHSSKFDKNEHHDEKSDASESNK